MEKNHKRQGVFVSYSHVDEEWLEILKTHLKPYMFGEEMYVWDDKQIAPGSLWLDEISQAIATARVAVLLVSPDFLASDFIMSVELPKIFERVENDNLSLIWVPVRDSAYKATPLADYQAASPPDQPLASIAKSQLDSAFGQIAQKISQILDINAVGNTLQIIDALTPEASAYLDGEIEPDFHGYRITAKQIQSEVSLSEDGQSLTSITADDLSKLPSGQRQLIRAQERTMQKLFDRWTELKPSRVASDSEVKERARKESDDVLSDLCQELTELLEFIEFMGMRLMDHYQHVRFICRKHLST